MQVLIVPYAGRLREGFPVSLATSPSALTICDREPHSVQIDVPPVVRNPTRSAGDRCCDESAPARPGVGTMFGRLSSSEADNSPGMSYVSRPSEPDRCNVILDCRWYRYRPRSAGGGIEIDSERLAE